MENIVWATKIINSRCRVRQSNRMLGRVVELVVDANKPRVIALLIKKSRWTKEVRIIDIDRAVDWWNGVMQVQGRILNHKLMTISKQLVQDKIMVLGRRAYSIGGERLGVVTDVSFNLVDGWIDHFVVDNGFGLWKKSTVLSADCYVETNQKGVIFKTGAALVKMKSQVELELIS
ncbi:MAG: PRC-barrel domain-containing protein [Patescibacteria group bacterium]